MLGTPAAHVSHGQAGGPTDHSTFTLPGESAYVAGGVTGLQAAYRTLTGQTRTIVSARGWMTNGKRCEWDPVTEKLVCFVAAGTEEPNGSLAGNVYNMTVVAK